MRFNISRRRRKATLAPLSRGTRLIIPPAKFPCCRLTNFSARASRQASNSLLKMNFPDIVVVDAGVNVHNTSEVLFHLTANTDPQRDSLFTKGPSDVLDHATSEIASGSKLGIDATKKIPGEGFKRAWPPLIKMDESVKARVEQLLSTVEKEAHRA